MEDGIDEKGKESMDETNIPCVVNSFAKYAVFFGQYSVLHPFLYNIDLSEVAGL